MKWVRKKSDGFTFLEVIIGIGIVLLISGTVFQLTIIFSNSHAASISQVQEVLYLSRLQSTIESYTNRIRIPYWENYEFDDEDESQISISWVDGVESSVFWLVQLEETLDFSINDTLQESIKIVGETYISLWRENEDIKGITFHVILPSGRSVDMVFPLGGMPL